MAGSHGRRRTHERTTNDSDVIIGSALDIDAAHSTEVRRTNKKGMTDRCRRDYRNRIKKICHFLEENYPEYYAVGVRVLSQEELDDLDSFHWKNTVDLVYTGMNVKFIQAFFAHAKRKGGNDDKIVSHEQLRKFHDAIMYGAKECGEPLPSSYYDGMTRFLNNYRKETIDAKRHGRLDEEESDPIPWSLFRLILTWSLNTGNIFLWVFSLLQWNCMARSINIGVLSLHCFRTGEDSLICKFDKVKCDQSGERMYDKNMYSNPRDPLVSINLALGIWFCLKQGQFENCGNLFQAKNSKDGTASSRYCNQLAELFCTYKDLLTNYIRSDHCNGHGIRKGAGTFAMCGTTCPASISAVAKRGDWSLGKILDIYWHFAEAGDAFLGRSLAGMDPNSETFGVLPPHFMLEDPMANEDIREAMELCFGTILHNWENTTDSNPTPILLRCFASLVFNHEWILETIAATPGHPFSAIPIINHPDLLRRLHAMVTISSDSKLMTSTGIPPHIETARMCRRILEKCDETLERVQNIETTVKEAVKEAYEEKQAENGHLSAESMKGIFKKFEADMKRNVQAEIKDVRGDIRMLMTMAASGNTATNHEFEDTGPPALDDEDPLDYTAQPGTSYGNFMYNGRLHWHVPKDFKFPQELNLTTGWGLWITGMPSKRIRPFRLLKKESLPPHIRSQFLLHWKPIFNLMESAPDMDKESIRANSPTAGAIRESLQKGQAYLRTDRLSYVFDNPRKHQDTWALSTWSKHCQPSVILKNGSEKDKSFFPIENTTRFNKARSTGLCKRKRKGNMGERQRKTQRRRALLDPAVEAAPPAPVTQTRRRRPVVAAATAPAVEEDDDAFGQAFDDLFGQEQRAAIQTEAVELSAAQRSAQLRCRSAGTSRAGDPLYARRPGGTSTYVRPLERATLERAVDDCPAPKPKRVLKILGSGALASETCDFCPMPTNHFCRFALPSSNITIQGKEGEPICGAVACMNCKLLWPGEPEDYSNRCRAHKKH
jgi:hypothetical protein